MRNIDEDFLEIINTDPILEAGSGVLKKIFVVIYLASEPISMEEIAKRSGLSLASISNKAKILESLELVKRSSITGERKVYLHAEKNLIAIHKRKIDQMAYKWGRILDSLPRLLNKYEDVQLSEKEKNKIEIIKSFREQIKIMLKLDKKFRQMCSEMINCNCE